MTKQAPPRPQEPDAIAAAHHARQLKEAAQAHEHQHQRQRCAPHHLQLRAAHQMIARCVQLELEADDQLPIGDFRVVVEVTLNDRGDLPDGADHDAFAAKEQLISLGAGLRLLLHRHLGDGEDFVVVTREQRALLEKAGVDMAR